MRHILIVAHHGAACDAAIIHCYVIIAADSSELLGFCFYFFLIFCFFAMR